MSGAAVIDAALAVILAALVVFILYGLYMLALAATVGRGPLVPILVPIMPVLDPLMIRAHRLWRPHRHAAPAAYSAQPRVAAALRAHAGHPHGFVRP